MPHPARPLLLLSVLAVPLAACGDDDTAGPDAAAAPLDPATAPRVVVDRFSAAAGTLQVRDDANGLPAAGAAIDMDQGPFVTRGLAPDGTSIRYYNFDAQDRAPAAMYLFQDAAGAPVPDQLPVVDRLPGDAGYSDLVLESRVTVPAGYVANSLTSAAAIVASGFPLEPTTRVFDRPLVPEASTAALLAASAPRPVWYRDEVAFYFDIPDELALVADGVFAGTAPHSTIRVAFTINPDQPGGGPASGMMTEPGTDQTHNVVETIPGDAAYSPLWLIYVYDNAAFDTVHDLASAMEAEIVFLPDDLVNCPVVDYPGAP